MAKTTLTALHLENFTAFKELDLEFSPGINIFIGENETGKTHLLKLLYSACAITSEEASLLRKLVRVFLPHEGRIGRLVYRQRGRSNARVRIKRGDTEELFTSFSTVRKELDRPGTSEYPWKRTKMECVYIPVKEMLSNAPGFRSLYALRDIYYEEIYQDIIDRAFRPSLRGRGGEQKGNLLKIIGGIINGQIVEEKEVFFLHRKGKNLEFMLLAEGIRKLALIQLLIQNGTFKKGSLLFWDEPEANLNPKMLKTVVKIILKLQEMGVQVFLATHDYVLLKEFDLQAEPKNKKNIVRYHALYPDDKCESVKASSTDNYLDIHPNAISDAFSDIFDRDVKRALKQS